MAILIEQEKKPVNWLNIIATVVFIVLIFVLTYFIFLKKPEVIETVLPSSLERINNLSQANVDPEPVMEKLKKYFNTSYKSDLQIPSPGKENPFLPF